MKRRFRYVAVGGTFDHLHKGHRVILKKAFESGEKVMIGVTSDRFAVEVLGKELQNPFEKRVEALKGFLDSTFPHRGYEIHPLENYFGPGILDQKVGAIVVSEETAHRVSLGNRWRREKGIEPMEAIVVPMVLAEDGKPLSTSRIKKGEINEEGEVLGI